MGVEKGKILLAEDDADQRDLLSEFLSNEGYQVSCAATAEELVERLAGAPDLVLLDVHGVVNPAVMKSMDEQPAPPAVVLLSGDSQLAQWSRRLHAEAQVPKPFDLGDLLSTIAAVLRGRTLATRVLSHTFA